MTHLDSLELRLSHERARLAVSRTDAERKARAHVVAMCEKEVAVEREFLRVQAALPWKFIGHSCPMQDDELLKELMK